MKGMMESYTSITIKLEKEISDIETMTENMKL